MLRSYCCCTVQSLNYAQQLNRKLRKLKEQKRLIKFNLINIFSYHQLSFRWAHLYYLDPCSLCTNIFRSLLLALQVPESVILIAGKLVGLWKWTTPSQNLNFSVSNIFLFQFLHNQVEIFINSSLFPHHLAE